MVDLLAPPIGSVWRGRHAGTSSTRHVLDRFLNGDICYVSGRFGRGALQRRCTVSEWHDWANTTKAKEVT